MITMDDEGIHVSLKTPAEIRQAIDEEIRQLNEQEAQARAAFASEMERIDARRDALEEMWRKTYETD